MSYTAEEVQKVLSDTISSIELQYNEEKKKYKERILELERKLKDKEMKLNELVEKITSKKKNKEDGYYIKIIENLKHDKEDLQKELENKINELKSALINWSTMENTIEFQKQNIMELELAKKKLSEEIEILKRDFEKKNEVLQKQYFFVQKTVDLLKDKENEYKKIIEEKDKSIEELNEKLKQQEDNNTNLLKYIKEVKEAEEKLKKEREQLNNEREKYNSLNQELMKEKNQETLKKSENEK